MRNTGFREKIVIINDAGQGIRGRSTQHTEYDIARQNVHGIIEPIHLIAIEEHGKDERDDDHVQEGVQNRPNHAEHRISVLIANVSVDHGYQCVE